MTVTHSLQKYITPFVSWKVRNWLWDRDRETETGRQMMWTQTGRWLLYWLFLNLCWDSIFKALRLCFLDKRFSFGTIYPTTLPRLAGAVEYTNFLLCRGVRPPFIWHLNNLMLELRGMCSTPSLLLLPGPTLAHSGSTW